MNGERSAKQKECCQECHSTCIQAVTQSHSATQSSGHGISRAHGCAYLHTSEHVGGGEVAYLKVVLTKMDIQL